MRPVHVCVCLMVCLLFSLQLQAQRESSRTQKESLSVELKKGKNDVRFAQSNLVVEVDYDRNDDSYTVKIDDFKPKMQIISTRNSCIDLHFQSKEKALVLHVKEKDNGSTSGRQKNRRVEMEVVFE